MYEKEKPDFRDADQYPSDELLESVLGESYKQYREVINIGGQTKRSILETKNIGKSKPCIFEITKNTNLEDIQEIIKFKILNK